MELRELVESQADRAHELARKYYDEGNITQAIVEYHKCAQFLGHLVDILPPGKNRAELFDRSKKFAEIAQGLKEGNVNIYTSGKPAPTVVGKTDQEELKGRVQSLVLVNKPKVKFADVCGLERVKQKINLAIVYPFKYPEEYEYFGVSPGGGILLYGPPGCGKTMLAAAAAAECEATFINLRISDIKDKYVGESEKNIREVFRLAQQYERAIIFFDELDGLAGERWGLREGHERSLVSELEAEMGGFLTSSAARKYLVLAASNRPWAVDMPLRRPGRFDTAVFIPHPDFAARRQIFERSLKNKPLSSSVSLDDLTQRTEGYASAEIVAVCQGAAYIPLTERIQGNKARRELTMADFEEVLRTTRSLLPGWYRQALAELSTTVEVDMFQELIQAAQEYTQKSPTSLSK